MNILAQVWSLLELVKHIDPLAVSGLVETSNRGSLCAGSALSILMKLILKHNFLRGCQILNFKRCDPIFFISSPVLASWHEHCRALMERIVAFVEDGTCVSILLIAIIVRMVQTTMISPCFLFDWRVIFKLLREKVVVLIPWFGMRSRPTNLIWALLQVQGGSIIEILNCVTRVKSIQQSPISFLLIKKGLWALCPFSFLRPT